MKYLTVIIPVYNEEQNINPLYKKLKKVLIKIKKDHEIIFIDDGSEDKTLNNLLSLQKIDPNLHIIGFKENKGQSAALQAGFHKANGSIVITMDGDLQNNPEDIPKLIEKINQGYEIICGWRYNRKDPILTKKLPSKVANYINRKTTKLKVHDSSCTLRAYKNHCIRDLKLFKGGHRLIPAILQKKGFKISEVKVNHNKRAYGKAKYNSPLRVIECITGLIKVMKNGN